LAQTLEPQGRRHDLLAAALGIFAAVTLASSPWNVDTEGPDPFYKGPLIFPLLVLSIMVLCSLPAAVRLIKTAGGDWWRLDGKGFPKKTLAVLIMLALSLVGFKIIGLEVSALAFLIIALRLAGHHGFFRLVLIPIIVTGLLVLIFKHFLGVFFPTPLVLEWFSE